MIILQRIPIILLLAVLSALVMSAGCNKDVPQSDLDLFIAKVDAMPHRRRSTPCRRLPAVRRPCRRSRTTGSATSSTRRLPIPQHARLERSTAKALLDSGPTWFESAIAADSTFVEA